MASSSASKCLNQQAQKGHDLCLEDLYSKCNREAATRANENDFLATQTLLPRPQKTCAHPRLTSSIGIGDVPIIICGKTKPNSGPPGAGGVLYEAGYFWNKETTLPTQADVEGTSFWCMFFLQASLSKMSISPEGEVDGQKQLISIFPRQFSWFPTENLRYLGIFNIQR